MPAYAGMTERRYILYLIHKQHQFKSKDVYAEFVFMVTCHVFIRACRYGDMLLIFNSLRENMIYLTALVVIFLFFYLIVTLIRPEWF